MRVDGQGQTNLRWCHSRTGSNPKTQPLFCAVCAFCGLLNPLLRRGGRRPGWVAFAIRSSLCDILPFRLLRCLRAPHSLPPRSPWWKLSQPRTKNQERYPMTPTPCPEPVEGLPPPTDAPSAQSVAAPSALSLSPPKLRELKREESCSTTDDTDRTDVGSVG
jgi:hypothetical protein